jgi:hypothetical protein
VTTTVDLTGQVFGKLTILGPADEGLGLPPARGGWWLARCVCGKEQITPAEGLTSGRVASCGRPTPERRLRLEEQVRSRHPGWRP